MAVNATPLSEPSGVYLGSHSGSSAFWQPAVEPGASMWVNGALGVSVLISPLFFFSPPLAYLFCLWCLRSSQWRWCFLLLMFGGCLVVCVGCTWASFNMSVSRGCGTSQIVGRSCETLNQGFQLCLQVLDCVECSAGTMDLWCFKCNNQWTSSLIYVGGREGSIHVMVTGQGQSTDQDPWCREMSRCVRSDLCLISLRELNEHRRHQYCAPLTTKGNFDLYM